MLKDFVKAIEPEEEELRKELKEAQAKLAGFQTQMLPPRRSFAIPSCTDICWRSLKPASLRFLTPTG